MTKHGRAVDLLSPIVLYLNYMSEEATMYENVTHLKTEGFMWTGDYCTSKLYLLSFAYNIPINITNDIIRVDTK